MTDLDEELRRGLAVLAPVVRDDGVAERVIGRGRRVRVRRLVSRSVLILSVVAGTGVGLVLLQDVFGSGRFVATGPALGSPVPIVPRENGLIAYTTGDAIILARDDGTALHRIPAPTRGLVWHVAWSPDGRRLAVTVFGGSDRSLWIMNRNGSDAFELATAENVGNPSWSPDGAWLAYTLERDRRSEVHVVRPDGSDDHVVRDETAAGTHAIFSASFSPDGTQLVFDSGTDVGYDVFVMDADGSNAHPLTTTGTDYNPSWSPDGTQILFTRQEAAMRSDIFVMNADGSDVRRLTNGGVTMTNLNPSFSPDGRSVTYEAAPKGGTGPMIEVDPDGSNPRVLVRGQVLGFSWQGLPETGTSTPSDETVIETHDLGLGYSVCNVSSVPARFDGPTEGAWIVATKTDADGTCPEPASGFDVVALDTGTDPGAETDFGPIECASVCSAMAAPDVDSDGVPELMVAVGTTGGSIEYELFTSLESGIELMAFDCQQCNASRFTWGGPGGHEEGAYCLKGGDASDLVVWSAERSDDGQDYAVVEITVDVTGRILTQVDRSDSTVSFDPAALPPGGGSRFCGVHVEMPVA